VKPFTAAILAASLASLALVACSKATPPGGEGAFSNELKAAPGAPVARGGQNDDGIKPAPLAPIVNGRGGQNDDGVKPAPLAPIVNGRGGQNDDGVKPAPVKPAPVAPIVNGRAGVPDDSIKPAAPGARPTKP